MKIKFKITSKIILVFSFFSIFLLLVLFVYLYFSSKNFISQQAEKKLDGNSRLFEINLKNKLEDAVNELRGIANHVRQAAGSKTDGIPSSAVIDALEKFLLGYPYKYAQLDLIDPRKNQAGRLSPKKMFSGEIRVLKTSIDFNSHEYGYMLDWIRLNAASEGVNVLPIKISSGKVIMMFNLSGNNVYHIVATLRLDYILDEILTLINLPMKSSLIISDLNGQIYYATDKKLINRNIILIDNLSVPIIEKLIKYNERLSTESQYTVNKWYKSESLSAFYSFEENIASEIYELNSFTWRTIIFSAGLFTIILIAVFAASKKMSASLNIITDVSKKVSEGDYTQKINIHRGDEIGLLINSFNEMVEKIKISYNQLNITNKELELKINELVKTKTELSRKEKLALLGETISKISHEIQNKIGGVSIWVQNLEMNTQDETLKSYIGEMKSALNSFLEMLVNFKRFYRQPKLIKSNVNINKLLERVLLKYSPAINEKCIGINTVFDKNIPGQLFDAEQMEEVFINLLVNAIHYSPDGGKVTVATKAEREELVISFSNEGPAIDDDLKEKIFQPFYTTKSSGSGLGLSVVHNIIDAHSGSIEVLNLDGSGVCFEIKFPISTV